MLIQTSQKKWLFGCRAVGIASCLFPARLAAKDDRGRDHAWGCPQIYRKMQSLGR